MDGVIARLVIDKGFGFIKATGYPEDLFFHRSAVVDRDFEDLREGQQVTFETGSSPKGPRAERVRVA